MFQAITLLNIDEHFLLATEWCGYIIARKKNQINFVSMKM